MKFLLVTQTKPVSASREVWADSPVSDGTWQEVPITQLKKSRWQNPISYGWANNAAIFRVRAWNRIFQVKFENWAENWKILYLFRFHTGRPILITHPRGPIIGQGGFIQPQNWMRQGVFSAWGNQTGPFAFCWATFVMEIFQLLHFHTGRPILITP